MAHIWLFFTLLTVCVWAVPAMSLFGTTYGDDRLGLSPNVQNEALRASSECFSREQVPEVELKPINYLDCIHAARKVIMGGKAGAPMHYSRRPDVGMQVPEHWASGSCEIRIDTEGPNDEDSFPLLVVANMASLIAQHCSTDPGLGGMKLIGPKKKIMIFVFGRYPPPPPRPRPTFLADAASS
ncbi:MAG: hypothetical protein Q9219_003463 [cf. Caloplaca sp. 3 TL-2023]